MSTEFNIIFLHYLVKPVVKFCLRRSITFKDVVATVRNIFIEVAADEIRATGDKANASRISLVTGIYREDVAKFLKNDTPAPQGDQGLLAEIIGQWERDPEFLTGQGTPRVLSWEGDDASFSRLVNKVRKGVYAPTVLFALERVKAVEKSPRGLRLIRGGAVTQPGSEESLELLSRDIEAFIQATEQNMNRQDETGEAYIRTEYDNISRQHLPQIRRWLVDHTRTFHKKARSYLSRFDKDLNSKLAKEDSAGERVILHSFSLSRPVPTESSEK